jgi:hypothetical protein
LSIIKHEEKKTKTNGEFLERMPLSRRELFSWLIINNRKPVLFRQILGERKEQKEVTDVPILNPSCVRKGAPA